MTTTTLHGCTLVASLACATTLCIGCSTDQSDDGRNNGGNNGAGGNSGGDGDTGTNNDFGNGTGTGGNSGGTAGTPIDLSGPTEVTGTYIWIANSAQGTVSKIDTRTMEELGRYITTPMSNGSPSRTSVGSTGAVVVANRGNGLDSFGGTPGITKIEAEAEQCEDRNNNGMIETSTGAADIMPWMQDECVSWFTPLTFYSNRPVSWAPPAGPDLPETVWTAGAELDHCVAANCTIQVIRLNGDTGAEEVRIEIGPLSGVAFVGGFADLKDYGPYGGASDGGGNFWGFISNTTHLFRIDALSLEYRLWEIPNHSAYGITVDPRGNVFLCAEAGLTRFEPDTETFTTNSTGAALGQNGCMTDGGDIIWVGGGGTGGALGLHSYNAITMDFLDSYPVGGVKGVSVDYDGNVWGVGGLATGDRAWRLDPTTGMSDEFVGLTGAYSYSDMTGFGLTKAGYVPVAVE